MSTTNAPTHTSTRNDGERKDLQVIAPLPDTTVTSVNDNNDDHSCQLSGPNWKCHPYPLETRICLSRYAGRAQRMSHSVTNTSVPELTESESVNLAKSTYLHTYRRRTQNVRFLVLERVRQQEGVDRKTRDVARLHECDNRTVIIAQEGHVSLTVGSTSEKKTRSFTGSKATQRRRRNERRNEGTRSL